jgi:diguanylate cyclase (GGDEF)-like protein
MDMNWDEISRRAHITESLPAKTWTLALLQATSAVGLAAIAAAPLGGHAPTKVYAVCGVVLILIAAGLMAYGQHVGDRALLAFAGVRVVVVGVVLAASQSAGATLFGGAGLIWISLWVTGFIPRRMALTFGLEVVVIAAAVAINHQHVRTLIDALPMLSGAALLSVMLSQVLNNLRHEARHDQLTGLMNRRGLDMALGDLWSGRRFAGTSSLVVIDLDGLKLVNDHAGHLAGDQMLVTFATELQTTVRGVDLVARIGGDEFIAILPGLSAVEATRWVAQMHDDSGVAWSFGVAERREDEQLETWLGRADKLMYVAKAATRSARMRHLPVVA